MTFAEYIKENFPNSVLEGNDYKIYTKFEDELYSLKNGAGIRVAENPSLIKLIGKESAEFLHRVSTNSVKDISANSHTSTLFLNEKGRFIAKANLLSFENEYWLLSDYDSTNRLFSWVNKFIIMEDIKTEDISAKFSLVELCGAQTESFLMMLIGDEIVKTNSTDLRRFDVDGFTFFLFKNKICSSVESVKILIEANRLADFIDYLFKIKSVFDVSLVGKNAADTFRIEKVIPSFPNEINVDTNPHEINLINDVCTTKGCYIGQEVIARLETYDKVQLKLKKVLSAEAIAEQNSIIIDDAQNEVGEITTNGVYANSHGYASLALVNKKFLQSANNLFVKNGGEKIPIKLVLE